jgi:hypothetical protein
MAKKILARTGSRRVLQPTAPVTSSPFSDEIAPPSGGEPRRCVGRLAAVQHLEGDAARRAGSARTTTRRQTTFDLRGDEVSIPRFRPWRPPARMRLSEGAATPAHPDKAAHQASSRTSPGSRRGRALRRREVRASPNTKAGRRCKYADVRAAEFEAAIESDKLATSLRSP